MSFGKRLLAAALLTTAVALGLSHAMARTAPAPANPGAMRADARHYVRIAPSEHGKNRIGSTYRNLGSDGDPWILSPTKHGRIIGRLRHVPPGRTSHRSAADDTDTWAAMAAAAEHELLRPVRARALQRLRPRTHVSRRQAKNAGGGTGRGM